MENDEAIPFDMLSTVSDSFRHQEACQERMSALYDEFEKDPETALKIVSGVTQDNMEITTDLLDEVVTIAGKLETRFDSERQCYDIFIVDLPDWQRRVIQEAVRDLFASFLRDQGWYEKDSYE